MVTVGATLAVALKPNDCAEFRATARVAPTKTNPVQFKHFQKSIINNKNRLKNI